MKYSQNLTKRKKIASVIVIGLCALGLLGEMISRFVLGLGDPPLSIADPQIEYMFKPSSSYKRFGNVVSYNDYSMRSKNFPKRKTDKREIRVMMIGDSVVNGGAHTDQKDLATEILAQRLTTSLKRPVTFGNISAGSWGPPNQLAFIKRFGFFDADAVVIVLNSGDYADVPTFVPTVGVNPDYPDHKPPLALQELFTRYLPRFLGTQSNPNEPVLSAAAKMQNATKSMGALKQLIVLARKSGAKVIVAHYMDQKEIKGGLTTEGKNIYKTVRSIHAPIYEIGNDFKKSVSRGENPFYDEIHPNSLGQKIISDVLEPPLRSILTRN